MGIRMLIKMNSVIPSEQFKAFPQKYFLENVLDLITVTGAKYLALNCLPG